MMDAGSGYVEDRRRSDRVTAGGLAFDPQSTRRRALLTDQ